MNQLLSCLPYHIAAELLAHPGGDLADRARRQHAVVLFADVSGFTPMSEALGQHGQVGTEELTALLNDYFEVMIDLVTSYGGVVGTFGGDAMTALFPADAGLEVASARAVQCALDMQVLMLPYHEIPTRAGSFRLAIKIGLAAGPIISAIVGDPELRLQSLLAGVTLERAAEAEHHARMGEVVLHRDLAANLPALTLAEARGDYLVVADLAVRPSYAPLPALPDAGPALLPALSAFLPPAVARRLLEDRSGFVNEHRSVTALFVGFDGFDFDNDPATPARFQDYVAQVTRLVQQYNGDLNKIDMGDKGSKFLIVFGAPVAHENDAERAMHCALALRDLAGHPAAPPDQDLREAAPRQSTLVGSEWSFQLRIGVASGLVYCGLVGATTRREYTVMGDTVNLAARLMQAATPGEIVVASGTHRRVAATFLWGPLESLPVKGRSRPVTVYRLLRTRQRASRHQEPAYKLPMVGREDELRTIEDRLELALRGHGQVVGVSAEAGMGKSRLLAEVIRLAARRGLTVINGECLSHGGNISYLPWHNLLRALFGIDISWNREAQLRLLREHIAAVEPQLLARLPLLAVALNIEIGETDLSRSLDARVRKDALEATVVECVRSLSGRQQAARGWMQPAGEQADRAQAPGVHSQELGGDLLPAGASSASDLPPAPGLLIVIEDCHWIDPLSHDLLAAVARGISDCPVLMLVAYRPPEHASDQLRVARLPHFTALQLREFSLRETEWLIGLKFGYLFGARGVLPQSFVERITLRSQGNPFYIDQMINYIQDQGISPADSTALERVRLPDTLRSLIISRIDRLSEQEQITLKVASVVGRVFRASWLWGIYPQLGQPDQVRVHLDTLSQLDLTPIEKAEPELEYLFKHVVTQEVAYESLALSTRTMLHEQVGRYIETEFAAERERYLDMLAFHYGRSENRDKQRAYFRMAGEAAQAAYANDSALDYYLRLLPLLDPDAQIPVRLKLGAVLQLVGRWAEAEVHIRQALFQAEQGGNSSTVARCKTDLAHLLASRGDYDAAITIIDEVMPIWERLDDPSGHYDALWVLGYVLIDIGEYTRGLRQLEHTHEIAVRLRDQRLVAKSIGSMGLVYVEISDYEMALYCLERSAQMAQGFSDWSLLAHSLGSVGFIQLQQGDLPTARATFDDLLRRAAEIGDRRFQARLTREIGRCHQLVGDIAAAMHCYAIQIGVGLELGERRDTSIGLGFLAHAYAQIGADEQAERLGELAIALCDSIRLVYWACEFRHDLARLYARQGRYAQAAELNANVLATARRLGSHKAVQLSATLLDAALAVRLGLHPPAAAAAALLAHDEEWFGPAEQAAIAYTAWQIDPSGANRASAAERSAALVAHTPSAPNLARHAELHDQPAGPALLLPALLEPITRLHYELEPLIEQVEALVGALA